MLSVAVVGVVVIVVQALVVLVIGDVGIIVVYGGVIVVMGGVTWHTTSAGSSQISRRGLNSIPKGQLCSEAFCFVHNMNFEQSPA